MVQLRKSRGLRVSHLVQWQWGFMLLAKIPRDWARSLTVPEKPPYMLPCCATTLTLVS